ncbi:GDP-mannose 4,6-dehydratase [Planococcus sp. ISL-109]|uniref:dTDP-glucose 4,6-dehydratase n=1 Tax=Planococcus sp. ISL-109 TaxID=2819166 RepID=UPI001BEAC80F|nr:GDP-mannose 4,6-dehydratase [Planococcus sp. ISL-109]MBT2581242.1 GDP-mannose 4,6-dehydratase [Planococcus sp. ISL-109]
MRTVTGFETTGKEERSDMRTILVTGGHGFLGSRFIHELLDKYPAYQVVSIDQQAENVPELIRPLYACDRYVFHPVDIRNGDVVDDLFEQYAITDVVHFAAETHVGESVRNPGVFAETNVLGTFHVLDAARKQWMDGPFETKPQYAGSRFLHISTDQVYGPRDEGFADEETKVGPISPYAASKASSDLMVKSFHESYGMDTFVLQASNVFGPHQQADKLIPIILQKALSGGVIPVFGTGQDVHDWLYIEDFWHAADTVFHLGDIGETYLAGGDQPLQTLDIVESICTVLDHHFPGNDSYKQQIRFVEPACGARAPHRFAVSCEKLKRELDYRAETHFDKGLTQTIAWTLSKNQLWEVV